ncbi:MAG: DUF1460 domain-containing protein [Paramuribaculum sp.]|nr:DUF1460 domain-containing protein [Paramuribaculum sp.]
MTICIVSIQFCKGYSRVEFGNEASDTTRLVNILISVKDKDLNSNGETLVAIGKELLNTPYNGGTLEGYEELVRISTDKLDCTTFVELVLSMGKTLAERRSSWRDVVYNMENIRYRGGKCDGYASRLHYISDWILDNSFRGNLEEVTTKVGKADYAVKTLDFMSTHRDKYPALKDSTNFAQLKEAEIGYRSHRFPYLKRENVKNAKLQNGDVVAFTTNVKGLDVTHIGLIVMKDGVPYLMHASSKAGKVIIEDKPLTEYLRKNQSMTGIRVIRLKE